MTAHQHLEGGLVSVDKERLEELVVRQAGAVWQQRGPMKMPKDVVHHRGPEVVRTILHLYCPDMAPGAENFLKYRQRATPCRS
jgi:hypothetical protein